MIKKSSLMKLGQLSGAFLLAGTLGCGDDGGGETTPVDANVTPPPPDACAGGGHVCGDVDSPFLLPEGGEIRLERYQLGIDDQDDDISAQAMFWKNQDPPYRGLEGKPITLREELVALGYDCADYRDGTFFDNARSEEAQAIADSRDYYDVGESVTITNTENPADMVVLPKYESADDPAAATDFSSSLVHDILYRDDGSYVVERGATYRPSIAGPAEYPMLDLKYGESFTGEEFADADGNGTPVIYMPGRYTLTQPTEADYYADGAVNLVRGQDYTIEYDVLELEPEDWPDIMAFVGFSRNSKVEAYCNRRFTDVAEDGKFVIPFEVQEVITPDAENGSFFMGRYTHVAWEVQQDKTRLDLIGSECKVSGAWVFSDPPPAQ
jgi:hypothetical protein